MVYTPPAFATEDCTCEIFVQSVHINHKSLVKLSSSGGFGSLIIVFS